MRAARASWIRRHPVWTGVGIFVAVLVIGVAVLLANVQSLRGPLERTVAAKLQREFSIGDLRLRWNELPTLELRDVVLGNLPGGSEPQMLRIDSVQVGLSLPDVLRARIFLPRIAVSDADVLLEQLKDGRRNWVFETEPQPKEEKKPSRVRLGGVSVAHARVRYLDHKTPMRVDVEAHALDRQAEAHAKKSDAPPVNDRYAMRFDIGGFYRHKENDFSGHAFSGGVLSLQDTALPFPLLIDLTAGKTRVQVEGTVADALQLSGIDVQLRISGPTLANLYPFLLLPLPASPPYALKGQLRRDGGRFAIDNLAGRIGSTDLEGEGSYVVREPRPLLTVQLRSKLLNMTDLGPLIGVETKTRTGKPDKESEVPTREQAKKADKRTRGDKVLPAGRFEPERLRAIDADARLTAKSVRNIASVPLENFDATLRLRDAVLHLDGLRLGVAGGTLAARATLDAREGDKLRSELHTDLRRLQLAKLVPKDSPLAKGAGQVSMGATLAGVGNSIADAAAKADGRMAVTISQGRISKLIDSASSLALGRVLALLATGDREIDLNCGAMVFGVKDGQGQSSLFVVDTEQTQVLGSGQFDLDNEKFAMRLEPKPKVKGLLSLRTPLKLQGSFSEAKVSVEKGPLLARAGAAIALAAVAPLAALIPLIETGPGEDTPCAAVLREARTAEAKTKGNNKAESKALPADAR